MNLTTLVGHVNQKPKREFDEHNEEVTKIVIETSDEYYTCGGKFYTTPRLHTFYFTYYGGWLPPINSRVAQSLEVGDLVSILGYIDYKGRDEYSPRVLIDYPKLQVIHLRKFFTPEQYKSNLEHADYMAKRMANNYDLFDSKPVPLTKFEIMMMKADEENMRRLYMRDDSQTLNLLEEERVFGIS
ncbi:MAG TPA: hypothetical protein DIV86_00615 [Alphaproteobacteria bacterium]|nr:hypothetical protein [Alphaproteobacteria bacterium]